MFTYALKRILLMIPTFFAISLLIFVLLNLGAGTPGATQMSSEGNQNAEKSDNQESYRIFKEQFGLDRPVLFNTRFLLELKDIETALHAALNAERSVSLADQMEARESLDDWGRYAVPALIKCLKECAQKNVRAYASKRLTVNARKPLSTEYVGRNLSEQEVEAIKTSNRNIRRRNDEIRDQWYSSSPSLDEKRAQEVTGFWTQWWKENKSEFDADTFDKLKVFFFDTRFARYWNNLLHLDFGKSHIDKRPVLETVLSKLKYSITLAVSSVILIYLISLPLGIWSAVRQGTVMDKIVTFILFLLYSLPSFFVAVILLNLFTVGDWAIFPNLGFQSDRTNEMTTLEHLFDILWHTTLPIICMSYGGLAALSRYARTGLLDVIRADYIRTARAKGLPEGIVIIKHAARNGMIPIITLMATLLPVLIGGSVIIEVIFQIPGMGSYIFSSITQSDYNAVMVVLLIASFLTMLGMLLADLAYALIDPRITFD